MEEDRPTAIVTGGTSGIGRAVARRLASEGAQVVIAGRDRTRGAEAAREIRESGGSVRFVAADVRSPAEIDHLFSEVDSLDYLFNNAGYEGPVAPLHQVPVEEIEQLVDTNLKGAIYVLRAGLPRLNEGGRVVNNASFLGTVPFAGGPVYGATKAALIRLTESVAEGYGDAGVRAFTVCPYNTDTPMIERLAQTDPISREQLAGMNPSGRLVDPEEVASVVLDLLAGRRDEPSGTALLIDAGPTVERVP